MRNASTSIADRPARRLRRPSWTDPRLVGGLLLILLSVVLASRVMAAADHSTPVFIASGPLVAGQRLDEAQLRTVRANLGDSSTRYLSADRAPPSGAMVVRDVQAGEFVPVDAVAAAAELRRAPVMVPVDEDAAEVFPVGSVVDVWVNLPVRDSGTERFGTPRRVVAAGRVSLNRSASGVGRAGPRPTRQVQVIVPAESVAELVGAADQGARFTLIPGIGSSSRESG